VLLARPEGGKGVTKRSINFGTYIAGDLYYPEGAEKAGSKLPCIIWLHPHSCSNGYVAGYKRGDPVHVALAREGFAVFAFDQIGFGSRIEEVTRFYERHPDWTLLGKMVADARAAVGGAREQSLIDPARVFVLGYGLGGMVALHAAALDERIAGAVSVAGVTPFRLDEEARGTGGLRRHAQFLPWLQGFVGKEAGVPYDFEDLIAAIAPRPLLVVAPMLDREATLADVRACVDSAGKVYDVLGAREKLELWAPDDYNRYSPEMQAEVNRRLQGMAAK
jgi:pimeloyl-ACP methyl ester carboxylesterase